jgi:predicted metal-dependent hydrolase
MITESKLKVSEQLEIPLFIVVERRNGSRASIGKKAVYFRISQYLNKTEQENQIEKFRQWALKHLSKKADAIQQYLEKNYSHGETITVRNKNFLLHIIETDNQRFQAKISYGNIYIKLPQHAADKLKKRNTRLLVIKCLGNFFYVEIANRLIELNNLHFQKRIQKFSLKYMNTRWGSCHAAKGAISISSRLLMAPHDVMDYVLIHELAHLVHMNHSKHFWSEVARVMPNYKEKEKWLRENDYHADF